MAVYSDPWSSPVQAPYSTVNYNIGTAPTAQSFAARTRDQMIDTMQGGKKIAKDVIQQGGELLQGLANRPGLGRAAFLGGMVPGVLTAASEAAAGRAVGAGAALGAGALTSGLGTALLKSGSPVAKLAGGALMLGGMAIPGLAASGAESVRQEVTGRPTEGKEGDFQTEVARRRQLAGLDLELSRSQLGMRTDNIVDLTQRLNAVDIEQKKAEYPILAKMKNDELIRSQSMLNSQNNAYMQQMVLGTASNLVLDAQRERGALARQYIASSPYNVVLAAPNVSIG
jgi:hypothetical protein